MYVEGKYLYSYMKVNIFKINFCLPSKQADEKFKDEMKTNVVVDH